MEETVVLKLQTYNDMQIQIAYLEEGMKDAVSSAIEAHEMLEKQLNGFKRIIRLYIERNTYGSDYREFYESEKDALIAEGIIQEVDAIRIEMKKEHEAEREAKLKKQREAEEKQALEDAETVRVIDETLKGE